ERAVDARPGCLAASLRCHPPVGVGIDPGARPHRAGDGHGLDVRALRRGRLRPHDRVHERVQVLGELVDAERDAPDRGMDVPGPVHPELDLTGLDLAYRLPHVEGDGARIRRLPEEPRHVDAPNLAYTAAP